MVPCFWHYGGRGSWCHEIVEFLTRGCEHHTEFQHDGSRAIVVIKADQLPNGGFIYNTLNRQLDEIDRPILIVTANEEGTFDTSRIVNPLIKIWLQTPHPHQSCDRALPWGWTPREIGPLSLDRIFNWSFAGQNSHARRHECIEALRKIPHGLLAETNGFSQGLSRNVYWELLYSTKLVPCPSGPITVDSFRVCEALEAGAIPILDGVSPTGHYRAYWTRVFGPNFQMPVIESWENLPAVMETWLDGWEGRAEIVKSWWAAKKAEWLHQLAEDIA